MLKSRKCFKQFVVLVFFLGIVLINTKSYAGVSFNRDASDSEMIQARDNRDILAPTRINPADRDWVTHILPTGRIVSPVGLVNGTPNFATAAVPIGEQYIAVLANGATKNQTITIYEAKTLKILAQVQANKEVFKPSVAKTGIDPVSHQDFFQGLAQGPDNTFFAAGGGSNDVVQFRFFNGQLQMLHRYPVHWQAFPKNQYPYQYQGKRDDKPRLFYPDALTAGPRQQHLYVTGMLSNSLARINLTTGQTQYLNVGPYPFAVIMADDGHRLVVSLWGGNAVAVVDLQDFRLLGEVWVGPPTGQDNRGAGVHPTALAAQAGTPYVYVALANVDRIAKINTQTLRLCGFLNDSPYPDAPPGSYPDGLSIVGNRLFVANAGNNDVNVFSLHSDRSLGLIPTGWYPTALTFCDGGLYTVAAKGLGSGPNVDYQWVGDMMDGLLQRVSLQKMEQHLQSWTQATLQNDGFDKQQRLARHQEDKKVEKFLRQHIHYVVFILRENKTFDEDLGKYKPAKVWADPQLDLYGPKELPNLYQLAGLSSLFVNFMADGEVTAQAHQWTTSASDSDFVQRTWPEYYSNRGLVAAPGWTQSLVPGGATGWGGLPGGIDNPYAVYENLSALGKWSNPWISYPERLFLFNDLLNHQVSFEDFGEFVSRSEAGNISRQMKRHLAVSFPGWDRMILDTYRVNVAVSWLKKHPGKEFPHFIYIWLPDDHTAGRQPCYYTPDYYVANSDYATAKFIHYLSTTPQWRHMAVFLTEDDAQSGADHINAHRTFALALGPWVKRGYLETHLYSQVNILKTIEVVFGLPPMSQWDQNASVLSGIWAKHPDFKPTPVPISIQVPVAFNPGKCTKYTLLRREVGVSGGYLGADWKHWYKKHLDKYRKQLPAPEPTESYSPTTLLKVPGPEQMEQEWVASKGVASYERVMTYLYHLAHFNKAPLAAYLAGEKE